MNTPTFDINKPDTPCYVTEECYLRRNCEILKSVQDMTSCKILLAQKAFSMYSTYPLISGYLSGTTASGLYEARLGYEYFGNETHVFSPAYTDSEINELAKYAGHFVFNSIRQFALHRDAVKDKHCLIRVNPRFSTQEGHEIYDPCAPGSRLGQTLASFEEDIKRYGEEILDEIDGLHFHTLCEQNSDDLKRTAKEVEVQFGKYLDKMSVINFGGGHHITRDDYDIDTLVEVINHFKNEYGLEVYLEPGEAVALNAGFLVTTVLDVIDGKINGEDDIAILDASAACHMPDVLEMPYRPNIIGAGLPDEKKYTYRLAGHSCLAGDVIGDYSFDEQLEYGSRLVFLDMAHYTMVKTNTFNGLQLPSIATWDSETGELNMIREFGYTDFKSRLS